MFLKNLKNKIPFISLGIMMLILISLQVHNAIHFPIDRGLDASGHIDYVNYIKIHRSIPLPFEGWELWQAPLYYFILALLPSINIAKILGLISVLSISLVAFILFKKCFNDIKLSLLGAGIIASTPVIVYLTPTVSNELFSAALISVSFVLYVLFREHLNLQKSIILGICIGLALLSKATATLLVVAIIIDQLIIHKKESLIYIFISIIISIFISGWFYIRNIILYGNPFVASFDFPIYHPLHQQVVERNFYFFSNVKPFITMDLFQAHHYSFIAGTYFSWFFDGHNVILPVLEFSKIGVILVIMSIPYIYFCIIGIAYRLKNSFKNNFIFIIYPALLGISYVLYNFRLPYHSTVKGVFLVSAIIPLTYFLISGIARYNKHINWIIIYFTIYTVFLLRAFWIQPHWY